MKKDLIRQLDQSRKRLLQVIEHYPDHPKGEWSRKQLLAHIAGWDEEFDKEVGAISQILKGKKPISFTMTVNNYNKISLEKRKNKTELEILEEMDRRHNQFIRIIKDLSEEQITGYYGTKLRGKSINVLWIINEAISHDNEHAIEIEEKYGYTNYSNNRTNPSNLLLMYPYTKTNYNFGVLLLIYMFVI